MPEIIQFITGEELSSLLAEANRQIGELNARIEDFVNNELANVKG